MGQTASRVEHSCAKSCKDWGPQDISTVKIDLGSIHALTCPENEDPLSCIGKSCEGKDKELVTDKENTPPQNSFKVPKLAFPGHGEQESMQESIAASTTASTPVSMFGTEKDLKVPRLNLQVTQEPPLSERQQHCEGDFQWSVIPSPKTDDSDVKHESTLSPPSKFDEVESTYGKHHQEATLNEQRWVKPMFGNMDAEQQLLAADLAEQKAQLDTPKAPKAWTKNDGLAFELKITRMGWSQSQRCLVRREFISVPAGTDIHPDMKVRDFKNLLKDHKMSLKSGEVIDTDDMVLTTPRELAVGGSLDDGKTLAESGVGPEAPDLLLLHTDSVRKACCSKQNTTPPASARTSTPRNQWQHIEQRKLEARSKKEEELAQQRSEVATWLKSNGFKDVNELIRKRLTKTRPLHVAVGKGDAEMVSLLLFMGADPRMCNGKSETPLLMAKRLKRSGSSGASAVVSALEEHSHTNQ